MTSPLDRYRAAHRRYQAETYPSAFKDFGPIGTQIPKTATANGLTRFIINFLMWSGHRATRVASSGRLIDAPQRQQSGIILMTKKFIPGTTRRGAADVSSTIKIGPYGVSVMWEVKIKDKPSEFQLREQALEEKAGGFYFFTHSPEEFFAQYDSLFVSSV